MQAGSNAGTAVAECAAAYPGPFEQPESWRQGLIGLMQQLPADLRQRVRALALDGTSGTLLLCRPDGSLAEGAAGLALPYHRAVPEQAQAALALVGNGPAASASGSLARALALLGALAARGGTDSTDPWWLRHQADWLMGWLLDDWSWGEEGNNLRLGWDPERSTWSGSIGAQPWAGALPAIRPSGSVLGTIAPGAATALGLPAQCQVVAGSTDANAGVLAADPGEGDGVAVLGTTLVLKQFAPGPLRGAGVSSHRVNGRWLIGGASNAGAGILRRFYSDGQLEELSRQIDPRRPTGLRLLPLPARGDRFPIDDPDLEPVLEPRPTSDSLYLQALLEGLTELERRGWQRLRELGAPPLRRVISLGGGARNPQWRALRQGALGVPVLNRPGHTAARGMALLAARALRSRMGADDAPTPQP